MIQAKLHFADGRTIPNIIEMPQIVVNNLKICKAEYQTLEADTVTLFTMPVDPSLGLVHSLILCHAMFLYKYLYWQI